MDFLSILMKVGDVTFSIVVFAVTLVFLVMGENDLRNGLTRPAAGTRFLGRMWHWMKGAGRRGWLTAIIVAAITAGAALFVLLATPEAWALVAWVFLLVVLAYVEYEWYRLSEGLGTSRVRRYLPSLALFLIGMAPGVVVFLLATTEVSGSAVWMTIGEILAAETICVFLVLFCQRIFVATRERRWKIARVVAIVFAVLVAIAIILANINWGGTSDKVVGQTENQPAPTETQPAPTETQPAPTETQVSIGDGRDPRFIQEEIPHENYRFVANFSERLKKNSGDTTATVLEASGHDAELLAIYARVLGIRETSQYGELLTPDGTYLSDEGIILYHQLEGVLLSCETKRIEVPSSGTNTGYNNGLNVAEEPGISGDRSGTKYVTISGDVFYILDRCGNYVYPTDPPEDIPVGPTDEKRPNKDSVNRGNADNGGGNNKPADEAGKEQADDSRTTEPPAGSDEDNHQGYSDPGTVTPPAPPAPPEHETDPPEQTVLFEDPMTYETNPVTDYGPVDPSENPTPLEGDGEFAPPD